MVQQNGEGRAAAVLFVGFGLKGRERSFRRSDIGCEDALSSPIFTPAQLRWRPAW